jgi:hypothetical protein
VQVSNCLPRLAWRQGSIGSDPRGKTPTFWDEQAQALELVGPTDVHRWLLAPVKDLRTPSDAEPIPPGMRGGLCPPEHCDTGKPSFSLHRGLVGRLVISEFPAPAHARVDLI